MKTRTMIFGALLLLCMVAAKVSAQTITLSFNEEIIVHHLDGRSGLIPNPDFGNLPSAYVYVIAYDLPELFGYEYKITSTDFSALNGGETFYPSTSANFGTNGDVRVGTGVCFHAGDAQAGPVPTYIRLAEHIFTWFVPPPVDALYCLEPSVGSGSSAPQYTECVDTPVPLPFGLSGEPCDDFGSILLKDDTNSGWLGCVAVLFQWEPDGTPAHCPFSIAAQSTSWGALKAAY